MKILLLILLLTLPGVAQQRFPSHDHEQAQHRKRGEPRRVVRTTPQIFPDDTARFYNPINDCNSFWARDDAPLWVKRQAARDKRDCLRKHRRRFKR